MASALQLLRRPVWLVCALSTFVFEPQCTCLHPRVMWGFGHETFVIRLFACETAVCQAVAAAGGASAACRGAVRAPVRSARREVPRLVARPETRRETRTVNGTAAKSKSERRTAN